MEPLRLVIPWDPHRTSNNALRRVHWGERSRLFNAAKTLARAEWGKVGWPQSVSKVRVSFVVRRGRAIDPLNALDGMKPICDSLFVRGITPDDSARYLEIGSVRVETGKQWRDRPEIVVTIEEL